MLTLGEAIRRRLGVDLQQWDKPLDVNPFVTKMQIEVIIDPLRKIIKTTRIALHSEIKEIKDT